MRPYMLQHHLLEHEEKTLVGLLCQRSLYALRQSVSMFWS